MIYLILGLLFSLFLILAPLFRIISRRDMKRIPYLTTVEDGLNFIKQDNQFVRWVPVQCPTKKCGNKRVSLNQEKYSRKFFYVCDKCKNSWC